MHSQSLHRALAKHSPHYPSGGPPGNHRITPQGPAREQLQNIHKAFTEHSQCTHRAFTEHWQSTHRITPQGGHRGITELPLRVPTPLRNENAE